MIPLMSIVPVKRNIIAITAKSGNSPAAEKTALTQLNLPYGEPDDDPALCYTILWIA